jgi:hypothetical protein
MSIHAPLPHNIGESEHPLSVTFVEENGPTTDNSRFDLPDSIITTIGNPEYIIAQLNSYRSRAHLKGSDKFDFQVERPESYCPISIDK